MARIPSPMLVTITDRTRLSANWTLAQAIAPAITGGVNLAIFRELDLPPNPRSTVARFVMDGIRGRAPMICSGDAEFAVRVGADGAFVEDAALAIATRELLGPDRILGIALTSSESVTLAEAAKPDFGLLNLDWSDVESAIEVIRSFSCAARFALIVGIDPPEELVGDILARGATGIAICESVMNAYNRTEAAARYARAMGIKG